MTRNELSQKICEGIANVFGRITQDPGNWLYAQDYDRGVVSITEHATSAREAMGICRRLEEAIGHGISVSSASRADESYVFAIDFESAKSEAVYTDGKDAVASIEKDGKSYMVDRSGKAVEVEDPDRYVANLNRTTGSSYRKAEDVLDARLKEAGTALQGTGCRIAREGDCIRVSGPKAETLSDICGMLPAGDDYYGSGIEAGPDGADSVVVLLPAEIFGVEELLGFIDKAACAILDAEAIPDPKDSDEWAALIGDAVPDVNMARRLSFMKNAGDFVQGLSDGKFAQAIASVRDAYGNDMAEGLLEARLGARRAATIIESLGAPAPKAAARREISPDAFEALLDGLHSSIGGTKGKGPDVRAIMESQTIRAK